MISQKNNQRAFSLVEVVLALGICSFSLTVLIGLLPVGLNSITAIQRQDSVTISLNRISAAILSATAPSASPSNYQVTDQYTNLAWTLGGGPVTSDFLTTIDGNLTTAASSNVRLAAHVVINPPASALGSGSALISVAWPPTASWDAANNRWLNAQGAVSSYVIFSPN